MGLSGHRAAVQQAFGPLGGNRVPTAHSAKKRPTDGCVGVGVFATAFFLQVLGIKELLWNPQSDQICKLRGSSGIRRSYDDSPSEIVHICCGGGLRAITHLCKDLKDFTAFPHSGYNWRTFIFKQILSGNTQANI